MCGLCSLPAVDPPSVKPPPPLAVETTLSALADPACVVDESGVIEAVNGAFAEWVGGGIGVDWVSLLHPADRDHAASRWSLDQRAGVGMRIQGRLRGGRAPGWVLLSINPAPTLGTGRWLCVATDVHGLVMRAHVDAHRAAVQSEMLDVTSDVIQLIGLDGTVTYSNAAGRAAFDLPDHPAPVRLWTDLVTADARSEALRAVAAARGGIPTRLILRTRVPASTGARWDTLLTPALDDDGTPTAIVCTAREVTDDAQTRDELRVNREQLALAIRTAGLGIWHYDIDTGELRGDAQWHRILGRTDGDLVTSLEQFLSLVHPDDSAVMDRLDQLVRQELPHAERHAQFRVVRPDGTERWVRAAASILTTAGLPPRTVGFLVDTTADRVAELALRDEKDQLQQRVLEDPLTGVANRRGLDLALRREVTQATSTGTALCIGVVDVDHFKAFNDENGHLAGDESLQRIDAALTVTIGESGFVARYGGDEFVFLTHHLDPTQLLARVHSDVDALAIPHRASATGRLTVSCGCAVIAHPDPDDPWSLLHHADQALYAAKAAQRGHSATYHR